MKVFHRYKHTLIIYTFIVLFVLFLEKCISDENNNNNLELKIETPVKTILYEQFAGNETCAKCHKETNEEYFHTAHYLTSQIATEHSIKGSFTPGKNSFRYSADRIVFLEKRDSGFYQVYYNKGAEGVARRFDIVVGSGTKGQTYLSWVNNMLIELPVSYFTVVKSWANSPGYPLYPVLFNRPATTRCMECHSTFAETLTPPMQEPERFDSTKMMLSVSCEKCHGPALKHVEYQTQNPNDTISRFIINPAKLSRQLNIDVCALCHAGRLQKTKPSFEFVAGDTLANYFAIDTLTQSANNIDVHGNQYGLLAASKCFRLSRTMTCTTCHDAHKNERGSMKEFSKSCATCHTEQHKSINGLSEKELMINCVDCHMPVKPSMAIAFLLQGKTVPTHAMMRTHFITIYPDETKKYINKLASLHKRKY